MRPPAPGFRAVPSQAAAIARPSPSAPPNAAIPTANEPIAGKNHEPPGVPFSAAMAAGLAACAIAVATVISIIIADITTNLSLIIVSLLTPIRHRRLELCLRGVEAEPYSA